MGFESTITEQDIDAASRQFIEKNSRSSQDSEPDLDVDGLSDSMSAKLRRFLSFGGA